MTLTRRTFLYDSFGAGAALLLGCGEEDAPSDGERTATPFAGGDLLEVVDWPDGDPPRFGVREGQGWDGRRYYDLAQLDPGARRNTPTAQFFLRTFQPASLAAHPPRATDWSIRVNGLVDAEAELPLASLRPRPRGPTLVECAGNDASARFGLMSCADWEGVALVEALASSTPRAGATAVRVSGVDDHATPSRDGHSTPGAAWVFSVAQLEQTGAFLATGMNGEPLSPDHGAPVRLVVPGWYGCTHIKWVDAITWVGADEPATAQMREFARRTHQRGIPVLAREYHARRDRRGRAAGASGALARRAGDVLPRGRDPLGRRRPRASAADPDRSRRALGARGAARVGSRPCVARLGARLASRASRNLRYSLPLRRRSRAATPGRRIPRSIDRDLTNPIESGERTKSFEWRMLFDPHQNSPDA